MAVTFAKYRFLILLALSPWLSAGARSFAAQQAAAAPAKDVQTVPAGVFTRSVGVNVHMEYTDGKYADAPGVLRDLGYLGIGRVRDTAPQPKAWRPPGQAIAAINMLASAGIRFDFTIPGDSDIAADMEQLRTLQQQHPGSILSVEGPNEINNSPVHRAGMSNEQAATAMQHALYLAVHRDPLFAGVPVLYFTGGAKIDLSTHPELADAANTHPYPHNGDQPASWLTADYDKQFTMAAGYPWQITETGYYTLPTSRDWGGVDAPTQARLMLNILFDAAADGVNATYIYQLLDAYPYKDRKSYGSDGHCGLYFYNGGPKPAAVAIHNLFSLLADKESAPQKVHYALQGMPATGHTLALSKSDGTVLLALWNEVPAWDAQAQHALHPKSVTVTVQIDGPTQAALEDPLSGKQTEIQRGPNGYAVEVPDYPLLLVLGAHPAAP